MGGSTENAVALRGSSHAALSISGGDVKNGSVTTFDVKDGSLRGADIRDGYIKGEKIKNGSLTGSDIDDGSLLAADFQAGQLPAGPQGPAEPQGPAGATNVVSRRNDILVPPAEACGLEVSCLPGEVVGGGGARFGGIAIDDRLILFSEPLEADGSLPEDGEPATQWSAGGGNGSTRPRTLTVQVLCASP